LFFFFLFVQEFFNEYIEINREGFNVGDMISQVTDELDKFGIKTNSVC
jgi:hypothetical protein